MITQVLVWLHAWGHPVMGIPRTARKPVVNGFYEELERAVGQAHAQRQAG